MTENATEADGDLPGEVVAEAERLTRLAREAVDDDEAAAYRSDRERRLADHDFTARVRQEDSRSVLVLHPEEWVEDGVIRTERVGDVDRAVEIPLSGVGDPDDWEAVDEQNRELVARVRERHGDVHGDNAEALADFFGNHYAKQMTEATGPELREFLDDYFPRNAWPTDEQQSAVGRSVELVFDVAGESMPDV